MMRSRRSPSRLQMVIASISAVLCAAGMVAAVQILGQGGRALPAPETRQVAVRPVQRRDVKVTAMRSWHQPRTAWPTAGTGTAVLLLSQDSAVPGTMPAEPTAGSGRAGDTIVWVGPAVTQGALPSTRQKTRADQAQYPRYRQRGRLAPRPAGAPATGLPESAVAGTPDSRAGAPDSGALAATSATGLSSPVRSARVQVLPHQVAQALEVTGTVFTVARADGAAATGRVHVSVDYAGFKYAYGGDYASRLHLVELPSCALSTPRVPACREQTSLASGDNVTAARAGADVTLPDASAGPVVIALTASPQGSGGDFAAEPVSEMTQWLAGGSSGAYEYTYPITVPPVPGGLEPDASLQYDSQLTDGISAAANPQASETGDGWKSSIPGYIEINYQTCAANWAEPDILDLCDQVQSQTLTLNGATGPIALNASTGIYKEENDDGSNVQQLSGGGWEVTGADGTRYYFGLDKLPGWTTGDPETNSIWTVPLWSGGSEETPDAVWRYLLDYVVDPEGNAIAYFYNTQDNYYATDGGSTANGEYTSGGVLATAEYGLRDNGNIYSQTPAAEISYTYSTTRQDAPTDLACASGAACSVNAPTFWTSDALTGITTESLVNGSLQPVDSYQLTDSYPATGDPTSSPNLWLSSIQQTGEDGSPPVTLPPTDFAGTPMPNLDQTSTDKSNGHSLITRDRLTAITSDTGGVTNIAYTGEQSACSSGDFPSLWANSDQCYPDYWYTNPLADTDTLDWYNLYAEARVTQTDTTGGNPPVVTAYSYGTPGWHYDNDDGSTSAYPTWDEWRGFRTVTTETGTSPDPVTETVDTYYQGLADDYGVYTVTNGEEGTGSVTITTSRGVTVTDSDQYAGMLLEQRVFDGAGGSEVSDTEYDVPWSTETAAQTLDSSLYEYVDAYLDDSTQTVQYTDLASGGSEESVITYTLNSQDNVLSEDDQPWGAPQTCTTTSYVSNTSSNLTEPSVEKVTDGSCSSPGALVSETQYAYDGGAFGAAPTEGLVTGVEETINSSGATALTTTTYDEYGRVTSSTDPDGRTTTTTYTPATGAEPTQVTVTDPMGLATVTTYDPARDLPLTVTEPDGTVTTKTYDALGRVTAEWTPGNATSGSPQEEYSYTVSQTAPSVDVTQTEEPGGNYLTSETLYDSLGRKAETQTETASGGNDITQYSYNSDSLNSFTEGPYYTSSAPSATLVTAAETSVADETGYAYDGDGREVSQTTYDDGTATWSSTSTYGGNYVTDVPPTGGTSQTVFSNALGDETAVYQYHAGVPASPSDPSSDYDQTSYGYTPAGKLASVTDSAGNQWSFSYDMLGDLVSQTFPDSGTTTASYDAAGQLMSTTNARGDTISFTYDQDGRKTGEYDTTGGALESSSTEIASWTWDTLAAGELTSATSYSGGAAYTDEFTGYNSQGLPEGQETIIPSAQGALAGTYTTSYSYAPDGDELSYTDSAAGGLPAETVTTGYNSAGEPDSLTGASTYVDSLSYTGLDQPLQYSLGTSSAPVSITDSYDPQTGSITEQQVQAGTANTTVDDMHYTYDADGLITSEADTPSGAPGDTDVQCFSYDYLGRLTEAWAQGSTGCVSNPTASDEGGPAPYLEQYSYNTENDLTGITATSATGTVTTTAFGYPAAGSAGPHGVTSATVTTGTGAPSTTTYGYDADGDLTSVTSGAGNQALTWSDNGKLAQIAVTPAGGATQDTGFIYDASGNELIRTDPGTVTLYLSDEELVLDTSTGTITGTRYYTIDGEQIAASTATSGGVDLAWLAGDSQHTETIAIDASTLAVTRRWYDPYGNPVGPGASTFPDGDKGFVGGTTDTATGLVNLGAREYQPATGSFISTDPILNPFDPQDLNPYAYGYDDPATNSDPTGMIVPIAPQITVTDSWKYETELGTLTISATIYITSPGDYVLGNINLHPNGSSSVVVGTPTGVTEEVDLPTEELVQLASGAAEEERAKMIQEVEDRGRNPDATYSQSLSLRGGDSISVGMGYGSVTVTISGSKTVPSGKNKIEVNFDETAHYQVTLEPPDDITAPPQLEKVAVAAAKTAAIAVTSFSLAALLVALLGVLAPAL